MVKEGKIAGAVQPWALREQLVSLFVEFSRYQLLPELNCSLIYKYSS